MFQLTTNEWKNLKSQIVTSSWGGRRKEPNVFTELCKALHNRRIYINRTRCLDAI
ncbi:MULTISPECIES: ORF6N domain-containing protein [Sphingobacterium]|uniref:ORF6N domain-containing protein n=1 Tax=Sphingobacterium TaxID=28453 RepID=UPI0021D391EC|nr:MULTISPECIES: ORF6N domain-containing protein [unclassified Sphingobacterium]